MKNNTYHIPVLVEQLLNNFQLDQNSVIIDGTIGFGGHAGEIFVTISNGDIHRL